MSDEPEKESKTEAPSEKRMSDAFDKGNNPFSREVVSLGSLLTLLAGFIMVLPHASRSLLERLQQDFSSTGEQLVQTPSDAARHLAELMQAVAAGLLPFLLLLAVGGIVGSLIQNVPSANLERVAPKWERLSPSRNLKRVLGKEAFVEFSKTSAKFLALGIIVFVTLKSKLFDLVNVGLGDPVIIPTVLMDASIDILAPTAFFIFLLAILDIIWTRLKWWENLKMTRQELKDEHKHAEGDPLMKHRRRAIALKRRKSRMLADVPKATLVVVNPNHYAVAMRYVAEEGGAPRVLAKGLDFMALKIREISDANRIPIVENKPLARSLYAACDVGDMIPAEHYRAVAEVIHFVERKRQLAKRAGI